MAYFRPLLVVIRDQLISERSCDQVPCAGNLARCRRAEEQPVFDSCVSTTRHDHTEVDLRSNHKQRFLVLGRLNIECAVLPAQEP